MKKYIISYRDEFSTIVEAKSARAALIKVEKKPYAYQWECIGDLHSEYLEDNTDEILADAEYNK